MFVRLRRIWALRVPPWRLFGIRQILDETREVLVKFRRRAGVPGLLEIVERRVVPKAVPLCINLRILGALLRGKNESRGGNTDLHKAPIIRAADQIAPWLAVRLNA